ncbi:MAG: tRNA (adenosine(37)-N6)-threonylcarbamoyltransferase complex dimerization subunit type 1 TsaB [bacterium]
MRDVKILGITSAINVVGAGIVSDGSLHAECTVSSKIMRSEKLIILVDDILERTKLKIKDIDAVAVTIGPGSYSGLRGGLATAKGLVEALDIPLISVSTLHAIAFNFIDLEGTVAVAVNACKDDYNFSLWGSSRGGLKRLTNDITVKMDRILEVLSSVKGPITLAADGALSARGGSAFGGKKYIRNDNILIAEDKNTVPWAVNVARIGIEKLRKNEVEDHIKLAPSYSHKPNIREHGK